MSDGMLASWFLWGIFVLVGIIFWGISLLFAKLEQRKAMRCTEKTTAVVEGFFNGAPCYRYTVGDEAISVKSIYSSTLRSLRVGQIVDLYFDPQNPSRYYVPEEPIAGCLIKIFHWTGVGLIVVGCVIMWLMGRFG